MADYYPLLARALDAMPERSPALRQAVYERRAAPSSGSCAPSTPPLSEDDIDLERNALRRRSGASNRNTAAPPVAAEPPASSEPFRTQPGERCHGSPRAQPARASGRGIPTPARRPNPLGPRRTRHRRASPRLIPRRRIPPEASAPEAPQPEATPPEIGPSGRDALPRAVPPPAPVPELVTATPPSAPEPSEPAIRIQARKGKAPPFMVPDAEPAPAPEAGAEPAAETAEAASQRQRPRIEVVAPARGARACCATCSSAASSSSSSAHRRGGLPPAR